MNSKTFYKVFIGNGEVRKIENGRLVHDGGKLMSIEFTLSELSRETLENGIKENMFTDQDISLRLDDETNQGGSLLWKTDTENQTKKVIFT